MMMQVQRMKFLSTERNFLYNCLINVSFIFDITNLIYLYKILYNYKIFYITKSY